MNYIRQFIFDETSNIQKSTYVWNMLAGLASALESVLFSMIVTRITGLNDAGIITIGFAIGNLMATIGKYGVRTFQVTDINRKYSFSDYLFARLITIIVMIVGTGVYIIYCYYNKDYSIYKTTIVSLICIKFVIEALEDVFAGECQKSGRLDVSSRIFVIRSICFVVVFATVLIVSDKLMISLVCTLIISIVIEITMLRLIINTMDLSLRVQEYKKVLDIILKCTPLFLSAFFFFYITNAPKYAIDTVMDDQVQACYSFIAFPVFAIELLNNFIYQPVLVDLAYDWNANNYVQVKRRMYKQILIVVLLTVAALICGYFLGIPVLSLFFSTDLSGYKYEMLVLLIGGGLLALIGYLSTILITMRQSMLIIYGYSVIFVISLFSYTEIIIRYNVMGGVILYAILCFAFALYEYLAIMCVFKMVTKNKM